MLVESEARAPGRCFRGTRVPGARQVEAVAGERHVLKEGADAPALRPTSRPARVHTLSMKPMFAAR